MKYVNKLIIITELKTRILAITQTLPQCFQTLSTADASSLGLLKRGRETSAISYIALFNMLVVLINRYFALPDQGYLPAYRGLRIQTVL